MLEMLEELVTRKTNLFCTTSGKTNLKKWKFDYCYTLDILKHAQILSLTTISIRVGQKNRVCFF